MRAATIAHTDSSVSFIPSVSEQIAVLFEAPLRHLSDVFDLMRVKSQLSALDDRLLADIGLSNADIDELDAINEPAGATIARLNARQRITAWADR
jgi:uncharacterized protein YjiS (DUF1127 family)